MQQDKIRNTEAAWQYDTPGEGMFARSIEADRSALWATPCHSVMKRYWK